MELLAAILVLGFVALAAAGVLVNSTRSSSSSEVRQRLVSLAQREAERLQSLRYSQLGNRDPLPAGGAVQAPDPLQFYDASAHTYRWDRSSGGAANVEPLAVAPDVADPQVDVVSAWDDGRSRGHLYAFVSWVSDARCGATCPATKNYKRITVAATLDSGGPTVAPVYVSSMVADPRAGAMGAASNGLANPNPLADPRITCTDPVTGTVTDCTQSVGSSTVNQWYLTDTPLGSTYAVPTADHVAHSTVACPAGTATGCPTPDLLSATPTPASTPQEPLHDYSTDLRSSGDYPGGRLLRRDLGCSSTPSADNAKGAMWSTAALAAPLSLNGQGGVSMTTQTIGGAAASVTLCLGLYDVNPTLSTSAPLGVLSYTFASWPATATALSFTFDFVTGGTTVVVAGHRIGMRMWVAPQSGADIAVLYDHPSYPSILQLSGT